MAQTLNEINASCPELAALINPADIYPTEDAMNEKYFPQLLDIMIIKFHSAAVQSLRSVFAL